MGGLELAKSSTVFNGQGWPLLDNEEEDQELPGVLTGLQCPLALTLRTALPPSRVKPLLGGGRVHTLENEPAQTQTRHFARHHGITRHLDMVTTY